MNSSKSELGVELNFHASFKYFTQEIGAKNICYFKSQISPWRGPQSKSLFWALFLDSLRNPATKKQLLLRPPFTFLRDFPIVWQILLCKCFFVLFSVQNLGHTRTNCAVFFGCGGWNEQEMGTCFSTFFNASNPQRTTLTYSVMIQREKYCRLCDPFQIFEFWVGMGIAFTKCFSIPLGALASIWQEKMVLAIPPQTSDSFLTSTTK